jgi:hypothetical protein
LLNWDVLVQRELEKLHFINGAPTRTRPFQACHPPPIGGAKIFSGFPLTFYLIDRPNEE